MAKLVEMDEHVTLIQQFQSQVTGPAILINKFNVESDEVEQFLRTWEKDATKFKDQGIIILKTY